MKRFIVLLPKDDGGVELHPMKEWLRRHPDEVPPGLDATNSTSHQLRNGLKKLGWRTQELDTEVRLIRPGDTALEQVIESILDGGEVEDAAEPSETAFALEYQLRDFIAQNIEAIPVNGKRVRLYVDSAGRDGVEYPTDVGPIDIMAVDEFGTLVVFELKRARSPDRAIGQLTRYMGWVKSTIGRDCDVHGIIVAKRIDDKLRYAVSVIPNVDLMEYELGFHLRSATTMTSSEISAT